MLSFSPLLSAAYVGGPVAAPQQARDPPDAEAPLGAVSPASGLLACARWRTGPAEHVLAQTADAALPARAQRPHAPTRARLCAQMSRSGVATMGVAKPMNAMPFLTAAKCQSSGLAGAEAGFDPLYFSDFLDVKWLREAELKHGRICMLCAPAAPRRRRAPARSPHAPPPLRRCRLAHFGAPRPQCVDGVHRAGVRVAPELPGIHGQPGRGILLRPPGGPGAGAHPPRAHRLPLRCAARSAPLCARPARRSRVALPRRSLYSSRLSRSGRTGARTT